MRQYTHAEVVGMRRYMESSHGSFVKMLYYDNSVLRVIPDAGGGPFYYDISGAVPVLIRGRAVLR